MDFLVDIDHVVVNEVESLVKEYPREKAGRGFQPTWRTRKRVVPRFKEAPKNPPNRKIRTAGWRQR